MFFGSRRLKRYSIATGLASTTDSPNTTEPTTREGIGPFTLSDATAWAVRLSAAEGQTLSGAGTLQCWVKWHGETTWFRVSDLDITVPAAANGERRWGSAEQEAIIGLGDLMFYRPVGVTVSGGTLTVEVRGVVG